ncbi:glycoside hydrolase family 3 N-terminal domain-containing protein [Persicobacter diffluens]|uniref:beta-N-acetylhexosaminidase n=1 Tax=Persicobacter diffluens TaxID=981 RepID=A0AAN5AM22_9BACT|nr:beta-N-acetylglucosaminidase [Persicobacter diffluens]
MRKKVSVFLLSAIFLLKFIAQGQPNISQHWADSVYQAMTPEQRIGQLFMVAAYSNKGSEEKKMIERLICDYHVGGLIFFQGGPVRQVNLLNHYQQMAQTPLWVGMDAEWGVSMRLDSVPSFPRQMTLGALPNGQLVEEMGALVAEQFKRLGMQVNFAPVADINVNPANPVIGTRSFGEKSSNVTQKSQAYVNGMQRNGVMANAKHFPGHGDTGKDSHYALPVIPYGRTRLNEVELQPFRSLIQGGVQSVMVGHLQLPLIDDRPNRPASLSDKVIKGILRQDLRFDGLVFTDALNMGAVAKNFEVGQAEVQALVAGNDVLLFPSNVPKAIAAIQDALKEGVLDSIQLETSVKKILRAKADYGLNNFQPLSTVGLAEALNTPAVKALRFKMYEEAVTLATNRDDYLPIQVLDTTQFAYLALNSKSPKVKLDEYLNRYADVKSMALAPKSSLEQIRKVEEKLSKYEVIVVGIHGMNNSSKSRYGIHREQQLLIERLQQKGHQVITVAFGNPYALQYLTPMHHLICAYDEVEEAYQAAAALIFGAIPAKGKLPVSAGVLFPAGTGLGTQYLRRLRSGTPEMEGMNHQVLDKIDSIAQRAMALKATPGMQVLVARNGRIIFDKAYGYHTYNKKKKVRTTDLYDLASVTKVAATNQVMMYLYGQGLVDIDKKASAYLPELKGTNKENMILRDILAHQAGLFAYYPFWDSTMVDKKPNPQFYSKVQKTNYRVPVSSGLYALNHLPDSLWAWAVQSPLRQKPDNRFNKPFNYRYSDIGMYMMYELSSDILNQPMEEFIENQIYASLGATSLGFRPKNRVPVARIIPSEKDTYFRNTLLAGDVNDPHAAMHGGAWGHAGLFGDALDLAKVMQMNLQGGYYGGIRYFSPQVVEEFTKQQYRQNRRGLGWDKPHLESARKSSASKYASRDSYGHSGFTGTLVWADPEYELVYIFLSNRTYPTSRNNKLLKYNIRPAIHDLVYESINDRTVTDQYLKEQTP